MDFANDVMSRFSDCPVCGKQVAQLLINDHLDLCMASLPTHSSADNAPVPSQLSAPPPPPLPFLQAVQPDLTVTMATPRQRNAFDVLGGGGSLRAAAKRPAVPPPDTEASSSKRSVFDVLRPRGASAFHEQIQYRASPATEWRTIVDKDELQSLAPLMLERDVLPAAEAAELLRWLQDDAKEWQRGEWVVHGRTHEIPRTSAWFTLDGDDQGDSEVSGNVSVYGKHGTRSAPPALREAAAKVRYGIEWCGGSGGWRVWWVWWVGGGWRVVGRER